MRSRLARVLWWLVMRLWAWALWLDARPDAPVQVLVVPMDALYRAAVQEVARADREETTASGQNKRHQVEGRLYHQYPDASRRAVSRAIEAALT